MISNHTATEIVEEVKQWCKDNNVPQTEMADLFRRISYIKGNRSFSDSMAWLVKLTECYWDM